MLQVPVRELKEGMIIAQSIYNHHGGSYLVKGQPITKSYIRQLQRIGIQNIAVTSLDPQFKIMPPEDIVQEKTRINAINKVYDAFEDVRQHEQFDPDMMGDISENILFDIINRRDNLVQLTDIRLHDTYTFGHSVNVAILSAMLGLLCHLPKNELLLLTLGALLHDLGKINIPGDILTKPSGLSDDEFSIVKMHPLKGAERIHNMEHHLPHPVILAAIASEHHEHIDGTGYPRGLKGDKIHPYAKIVAIADVYDALTSERPYKKAYTPNIAHNIMTRLNRGQFDPDLLQLFFNNVAIYPEGTILKTDFGYGIVKHCEFGHTETPTIVVFADLEGHVISPETIDLGQTEQGSKAIQIVIADNELRHFIHRLSIDPSVYLKDGADDENTPPAAARY